MRKIIEKYSTKPKNLFKKIFFTLLFGYIPFALLHIVLNLFKIIPVNFNDKQLYGIKGVLVIIMFIPFVVFMLTFFAWLHFMLGNLILRIIKKTFYE